MSKQAQTEFLSVEDIGGDFVTTTQWMGWDLVHLYELLWATRPEVRAQVVAYVHSRLDGWLAEHQYDPIHELPEPPLWHPSTYIIRERRRVHRRRSQEVAPA